MSDQIITQQTTAIEPSVGQMLSTFIARGITSENVDAFSKLIELRERMEARESEKEFAAAFSDMQKEIPRIEARGQSDRYNYIKYEDIMYQLSPLLNKHGFSVTFSTKVEESRITQFCTVTHRNGHSRTNQYTVRLSNKTPGLNECQQDGLAGTYAKRYAVCNAFNITAETDMDGRYDARNEGAPINWEQCQFLEEQIKETGSDKAAFLAFAGAATIPEIGSNRYDELVRALAKKAKK